jgi:nicotinamidase-related amidase
VLLFIDHQTGLFQTVHDISLRELKANVIALAKLATLRGVPVISTASEPLGPNGPLMTEYNEYANVTFIRRHGEISAWENPDFVAAVERTGRRTLLMAGVWTSVCVAFPALQALAEGYKVYAIVDASGDLSVMGSLATQLRMQQAGVILVTTNVVTAELQRTWNRPDAADYAALYPEFAPNYGAVIESYNAAKGQ